MKKIIAYKKELLKYNKGRNELIAELDEKGKLETAYVNICGFIIPINKVYKCTDLKTEINFEHIKWELK